MLRNFMEYFRQQIEVINALCCAPDETIGLSGIENVTLYKKIAYVSLLDCFASIRFNRNAYSQLFRKNTKRFTRFLEECGDWEVGGLISLDFLRDRLPKASADGKLSKYINQKLSNLGNNFSGIIRAADVDVGPARLLELASAEAEEEAIFYCQHYSIMYRYRNNLVHQARRPGGALEGMGQDQSEACYHNYVNDPALYLLYPLGLFRRLCKSSLVKLGMYLEDNNLDPHQFEDDPRCF